MVQSLNSLHCSDDSSFAVVVVEHVESDSDRVVSRSESVIRHHADVLNCAERISGFVWSHTQIHASYPRYLRGIELNHL